jgi:pyruvate/2-oxoglutarate dehydrogenase complex dihydrolipoamide acyltransferase (E2) component
VSIRPKIFTSPEEILQAIAKLQGRIAQVEELGKEGIPYRDALRVTAEVQIKETIREIFGEHSPEFRVQQHHRIKSHDQEDLLDTCAMLEGLIENLEEKRRSLQGGHPSPGLKPPPPRPAAPQPATSPSPPASRPLKAVAEAPAAATPAQAARPSADPLARVRRVSLQFHAVARQMRQRHDGRATLEVEDAHDVRDLLRALLCVEFEDVRAEPATGDAQGRTDLLIEREQVAVIVKKTRHGYGAKEISGEVRLDAQRYAAQPDCRTVFCFVYDPEGRIVNPRKLEQELKSDRDGRLVEVLIAPK